VSRIDFETSCRAGAIALVDGYRTTASLKLGQLYRARPTKITPPSVFVDSVAESTDAFTNRESQRTVRVGLRAVWGVYDAGGTVDQRDRFVDGFYGYVMDNGQHAFGANTTCSWIGVTDNENWTAEWLQAESQSLQPMFATLITLEGFAST
jgi:hypothetical protein